MPGADGNFLTAAISGVIFVMSRILHVIKIQQHVVIFFQPFSYAGSVDGSVSHLAHNFGPDWNILTTVGCVAMNLCQDIRCPQRMNSNDFVQYFIFFTKFLQNYWHPHQPQLYCVFNANADVSMLSWYSVHICFLQSILRDPIAGGQLQARQLTAGIKCVSHLPTLYANIYRSLNQQTCFYTKKETSSCIMFADLTGRPKWLRICCKQCFTGFIMSLPTEQVSKLSVF